MSEALNKGFAATVDVTAIRVHGCGKSGKALARPKRDAVLPGNRPPAQVMNFASVASAEESDGGHSSTRHSQFGGGQSNESLSWFSGYNY